MALESAIRPPRPSPTGIIGAPTGIVSNRLADFAVNGFQDPPCCHLRSKGFRFSRAVAIALGKFRFAPSASSVWPVLGSWLLHTRRRLLNLPTLQGAWPENIRFDKTIVFSNSLSFAKFCRYPSALQNTA